jgi:hypothetical protein
VGVCYVAEAGHEALDGRDGVLSSRQVIGHRVDPEGGQLGRKPLIHFLRSQSLPSAKVQLAESGIYL